MNRSGSQNTVRSHSNLGAPDNVSLLLEQSMKSQFMSNTVMRGKPIAYKITFKVITGVPDSNPI